MRDRTDLLTPDLFAAGELTESHRAVVCRLVAKMLHGRDRQAVARQMSQAGHPATKPMLDAWASTRREAHNLPAYQVPALEAACGDAHDLTDWLVAQRHGRAAYGPEAIRSAIDRELADLEAMRAKAARSIRQLRDARERVSHA